MGNPVVKATFTFKDGTCWDVMLNPSELSLNTYSYEQKQATNGNGEEVNKASSQREMNFTETVSMLLHFDLVPTYEALTNLSTLLSSAVNSGISSVLNKIPGFGDLVEDDTVYVPVNKVEKIYMKVSLFNEDLTCFKKLDAAAAKGTPVVFEWSEDVLRYYGKINNFSARIDCFSKFGGALRAEVNLSMVLMDMPDEVKSKMEQRNAKDVKQSVVDSNNGREPLS